MSGRGNPGPDLVPDIRPCDQLVLEVVLVDVDMAISARVSVADRLPVSLVDERYPAAFLDADRLGSIASGALSRLVQCLREGETFGAEILVLDAAYVKVRVSSG
jgi:hypothetical protein